MSSLGQVFQLVGVLTVLSSALGAVTIKRDALFENTVKRWNVNIRDKRDHNERLARFERSVEAVERTTSGVMLDSLNAFSVMNDKEWENIAVPMIKRSATTTSDRWYEKVEKRSTDQSEELPKEYNYWEEEVGLSPAKDQFNCGACWSFPDTGAIEALNTHLTGDRTEFSQQYFVDCTFNFSGCNGGTVTDGFKTTMKRQFMVKYEDYPFTGEYTQCPFKEDIENMKNNAMDKIWIQDYVPLAKNEEGLLRGLKISPVSVAMMISNDLFSYSGGLFTDHNCATEAVSHAMLLVGYTETTLRIKASYGEFFGERGYVNYKRDILALQNCNFFSHAYALTATYRRDMEYEYCNDHKPTTHKGCEESCAAMNTDTETGWSLAVIPTQYHNEVVMKMLEKDFPGKKNVLWIGLEGVGEGFGTLQWVDGFTPANYQNVIRAQLGRRYGLLQQEDGKWVTKGSPTFVTRGLCSRAINCWNIESAVKGATVTFSDSSRVEGTVATVECTNGGKVLGASKLKCVGGRWDTDLPECSEPEPEPEPEPELLAVPQPMQDTGDEEGKKAEDAEGQDAAGRVKKCRTRECRRKGKQSQEEIQPAVSKIISSEQEQTSGKKRRKHKGEQPEKTESDTEHHSRKRKHRGNHD